MGPAETLKLIKLLLDHCVIPERKDSRVFVGDSVETAQVVLAVALFGPVWERDDDTQRLDHSG